ncbi:hypothetical protein [Spiroplasma endosymbiont of Poecilobothrus nobilitatus]|uniref:hypothetical protein n=1 Tax=Spiroplasma endosymbiont of Poecilobothrus nobilitatus TaxID=1209220 RepID=UPI00313E6D48
MKKDMIILSVEDFLALEPDENIREVRHDAEYQFDYESWKTILYSSGKLKFILRYVQAIFQWMKEVTDLTGLTISISAIIVDKFNLSLFKNQQHLFNCSLSTNFYLIPEIEWAEKITEAHASNYDLVKNQLMYDPLEMEHWKEEEGFGKFINMLLIIIRNGEKLDPLMLPIQWIIEFKDKKLTMSRIRMQIQALQNRTAPDKEFIIDSRKKNNNVEDEIELEKLPSLEPVNKNDSDDIASWNKYYKEDV